MVKGIKMFGKAAAGRSHQKKEKLEKRDRIQRQIYERKIVNAKKQIRQ